MYISTEEKRAEAVARMKLLGIFPETIRQFEEDGKISISEPPVGAFYWLEGEDLERIREFEERYNAMVYMAVRSDPTFGKMDCYLYVCDHQTEWEYDRRDLREGEALAYVYNYDAPDCSEIGRIGIKRTAAAGIARTW